MRLHLLLLASACTEAGPSALREGPFAGASAHAAEADVPTWHQDVAPILAHNCAECHDAGGIAPFPLITWEDASPLAELIADATAARRMPPYNLDNSGACNTWREARWLSDDEIATIGAWALGGAPEGDPADELPEVPAPWELDRVDLTLEMEEPYTPDDASLDDYRCFVLDPGLSEDRFITGFQVRLGDPRMVHHLTLFAFDTEADEREAEGLDAADPGMGYSCFGDTGAESRWLVGSGPGDRGDLLPEGTGTLLRAGRKTVLQMHYNRLHGTYPDLTAIDLALEPSVLHETFVMRIAATELELPPGLPEVVQRHSDRLPGDATFWGVWPHMHNLGTQLRVTARRPGTEQCLARVDRWQFPWQGFEFYTEPLSLREDDTLEITCTYDTTGRDTTTRWGSGTEDEMCIGFFYVSAPP